MRVLVTSSRNPFALDIIRKLGSSGHSVVASDTYGGAVGSHSKYLTGHEVTASPRYETDRFIDDVNGIVEKYGIEVILPSFEEAFYLAARSKDLPEDVTLYTGNFDKLARLHDKASFKRLCQDAGVPVPETTVVTSQRELQEAIQKYPRYFARAAFSRGGVALLTNTGPLAGKLDPEDVTPTPDQPWLVQPFVDGPMVCTYSTIVEGRITSHCTYSVPEQWDHSTGVAFLAVDSTETLEYIQKLVDTLDPHFTGQLSFDFVNDNGQLYAIECNPRPTNGVILIETEGFVEALQGKNKDVVVAVPGTEREIKSAVVADAFTEPLKHLPTTLHDAIKVKDIDSGWHDSIAMMWSPASLVHGAKLSKKDHGEILAALGDDIVWNGEPIPGMTKEDADALEAVHEGRNQS